MDARLSLEACRFLSGQLGSEIQTGELASTLHCPSRPCFHGQPQTRVVAEVTGDKYFLLLESVFTPLAVGFTAQMLILTKLLVRVLPCPALAPICLWVA